LLDCLLFVAAGVGYLFVAFPCSMCSLYLCWLFVDCLFVCCMVLLLVFVVVGVVVGVVVVIDVFLLVC
jgi:hypothetical protein